MFSFPFQVFDPVTGGQKPFCSIRGSSIEVNQYNKREILFWLFQVKELEVNQYNKREILFWLFQVKELEVNQYSKREILFWPFQVK